MNEEEIKKLFDELKAEYDAKYNEFMKTVVNLLDSAVHQTLINKTDNLETNDKVATLNTESANTELALAEIYEMVLEIKAAVTQ